MARKRTGKAPKSVSAQNRVDLEKLSLARRLGQWHESEGKALIGIVTPVLAIVSLCVSLVSCHNSSVAASQSEERIAVSVSRVYGNERIEKGYGIPLIMSRWAVDINNLSSNSVSVLPPYSEGITDQNMANSLGTFEAGQEPARPIFIGARGSARVEVDVPIPFEESSRKLVMQGSWSTFEDWRVFAKAHGLSEIGAPMSDHRNAAAQVIVQSVEGRDYYGLGLWYPGNPPPNYKSR